MPTKPPRGALGIGRSSAARATQAITPADEVAVRTGLMRELAALCCTLNRIALKVEQDITENAARTPQKERR